MLVADSADFHKKSLSPTLFCFFVTRTEGLALNGIATSQHET